MAGKQLRAVVAHLQRVTAPRSEHEISDGKLLHAFVTRKDGDAFAALIARHGPMVYALCRRLLGHVQDAEDAFQATFLVLASRARSISKPESLASWLHGVALRISMKTKRRARDRKVREAAPGERLSPDPARAAAWHELQEILDAEIQRLPERYRAPFLLCHCEGRSRADAAAELGVKEGTVWSRLAEARRRLHARLVHRGITLSAALGAAAMTADTEASVPVSVQEALTDAAMRVGRGEALKMVTTTTVADLVKGFSMPAVKRLLMIVGVIAVSSAAGVVVFARSKQTSPTASVSRQMVAATRADVRPAAAAPRTDLAGDPLPDDAMARLGTLRLRQGTQVDSMSFTPDGKRLIAEGAGGLRIWDVATGSEIKNAGSGLGRASAVAISPDGKQLAVVDQAGLTLRDASTGKILQRLGQIDSFRLHYTSDGKTLVAFCRSNGKQIYVWDVASGRLLHAWTAHDGSMWGTTLTSDGQTAITGGEDCVIRFWKLKTGEKIREITGLPTMAGALALSPDRRVLASIGWRIERFPGGANYPAENRLFLWDAQTGSKLREIVVPWRADRPNHVGFTAVAWSPDSSALVTDGPESIVRVWDARTGKQLRVLAEDLSHAYALAFSPDGKVLAAAPGRSLIRLIDFQTGKDLFAVQGHQQSVNFVAFRSDSRTVATAGSDGSIRLWDAGTGMPRKPLAGHDGYVTSLHASGPVLGSTASDGDLCLWDMRSGERLRCFKETFLQALNRDATVAVVSDRDGSIRLLDLRTGTEIRRLIGYEKPVQRAWFINSGRELVSLAVDGLVLRWDVGSGEKLFEFGAMGTPPRSPRPYFITAADLSADGRLFACGSYRSVTIQETATGKVIRSISDLPESIMAMALSPDGRMVACSSAIGEIRLLDSLTGQTRRLFHGHRGWVGALAFSPDGSMLVSGSADTTALVWDLGRARNLPIAKNELEEALRGLHSPDAASADRAIRRLLGSANAAVAALRREVLPVRTSDGSAAQGATTKGQVEEDEQTSPDRLWHCRALETLERVGNADARQLLRKLATGAPSARLTQDAKQVLERLCER